LSNAGYTPSQLIHDLKELVSWASAPEPASVYGLMAEFATADDVVNAARAVKAAGYRHVDGYSPYPMESLIHELDQHHSWVPAIVLGGGLSGFLAGYGLEYWSSVIAYPMNIGGRPFHSWVSFIPPAFETTILFASFGAVIGMLALNGFPRPYHPVFNIEEFAKSASNDKFYIVIESADPKFDAVKTAELLKSCGPTFVKEIPA
jgi:Protein of unknown function (DUF3341)